LNNVHEVKKILNKLQKISNIKLKKLQKKNIIILKKFYNWDRFQMIIKKVILEKRIFTKISYNKKEIIFFKKNLKDSPNYYLNLKMILIILKSNMKIFFTKLFN